MYQDTRLYIKDRKTYNKEFYIFKFAEQTFKIPKVYCKRKEYIDIKYDKSGNIKILIELEKLPTKPFDQIVKPLNHLNRF